MIESDLFKEILAGLEQRLRWLENEERRLTAETETVRNERLRQEGAIEGSKLVISRLLAQKETTT